MDQGGGRDEADSETFLTGGKAKTESDNRELYEFCQCLSCRVR